MSDDEREPERLQQPLQRDAPVRLTLLLADSAQASPDAKVHMLGGGWTTTLAPVAAQMAIAGTVSVDWDATNERHRLKVQLVDGDGAPVPVQTPAGEQPWQIESAFECGRPPGFPRGMAIGVPLALNFIRPPLPPGPYAFVVEVNDQPAARLPFQAVAAPTGVPPQS
ncbi:MAG: hypothetical protein JO043_07405 [Candidatus Eremiobacteraeota bacterium]|nr:hypothetical protein [Candidatus Eremiobacteraeota bacterium]